MKTTLQLAGLGLRKHHIAEWLETPLPVAFVEVHTDNYLNEDNDDLIALETIAKRLPVSLHGVGLSLGSTDPLNWAYLFKLKRLITRIKPCFVSDHLAWCSLHGRYYHDLFPLPLTEESLNHVATRILEVQQFLKVPILIENIANYVTWKTSTIKEQHFLAELSKKTGCGLLLDINNAYISATHLGFSCEEYLDDLPAHDIQAMHLGGHRAAPIGNQTILLDSHDNTVDDAVWSLFSRTIHRIGVKPTLIEWDKALPTLDILYNEAYRADMIMREIYAARKCAS